MSCGAGGGVVPKGKRPRPRMCNTTASLGWQNLELGSHSLLTFPCVPLLTGPVRSTCDQDSQEDRLSWVCGLILVFFVKINGHCLGTLLVEREKVIQRISYSTLMLYQLLFRGWGRPKVLEDAIFTPKKSRR